MILTAHQPVYLPWLGLFHKIAVSDKFCFFDRVQYQAKDWNNRNKIKFSNGQADWLSVPVLRKGYLEGSYLDLEINNAIPWRKKHWRSLELNYCKAPYFKEYSQKLKYFYERDWQYLVDLNYEMLLFFMETLGINVPVVRMKDCDFQGEKSDLVLDMCVKLGADGYIFGALGKEYADVSAFRDNGIELYFQDYEHPVYPQQHGDFISHLSIIDLLFNCGPESLKIMMEDNISREDLETLLDEQRSKD
ncbi:MAG: hypothetical protein A2X49_05500 [Lentisphaerae bacterium GWF2_52_8]|nr:MAG: hypothetical protein A2X49_05500 [Lentisphaerae bacterium GWF2_52_8]